MEHLRNLENQAIYQLTQHRGWRVFVDLMKDEEKKYIEKLLKSREPEFRDAQGSINALRRILTLIEARIREYRQAEPTTLEVSPAANKGELSDE